MKVKYASIFAIVLVLLSGIPLVSGAGMNYVNARYAPANTQSQGNANDCDTVTNCAINSPQTQGDGSASSPSNLQISKFNDEQGELAFLFDKLTIEYLIFLESPHDPHGLRFRGPPSVTGDCIQEPDFVVIGIFPMEITNPALLHTIMIMPHTSW